MLNIQELLLVTEATLISNRAGGYDGCPKISTQEETKAWKKLLMLFIQRDHFILSILVLGRVGYPSLLKHRKLDYLAPSPIYENEKHQNRQKKPDYHYVKLLNKKFMILFIMIILLLLKCYCCGI